MELFKGSAPEQRAKRAVEVARAGAAIIDKLLLVGGAVPILGNVCTTAREIFRNVEQVARKVGDVLEMGERVLEALALLERMGKNIEMFPVTDELRDGWQSLRDVLWLILDSVETFGRKGWVKRVLNASMKLGSTAGPPPPCWAQAHSTIPMRQHTKLFSQTQSVSVPYMRILRPSTSHLN